jgi:hypothetical protein
MTGMHELQEALRDQRQHLLAALSGRASSTVRPGY